ADTRGCRGLARHWRKMERRDAGIWIAVGENENVTDVVIGGHWRINRHRQGNGIAGLGNLGEFDWHFPLFRRLGAGELGDLIRRLFRSRRNWPARTYEAKRRTGSAKRQGSATRQLPHRLILHEIVPRLSVSLGLEHSGRPPHVQIVFTKKNG